MRAPISVEAHEPPLDPRSRQLVDALREGFFTLDADWRFTDCNAVAERLLGRCRSDLLGRHYCDVAGLGPDTAFAAAVARVAAKGTLEEAEIRFRGSGRSRLLAVRAFALGEGIGAMWNDITSARAAERRLALSEARYRAVAEGLPTAAWLSRTDGKLVFINQAMIDALGRAPEELLGDGWMDSLDPASRASFLAARALARANHSSVRYEGRFRRPDGSQRIIQMYGRPRFNASGAFCGLVGIAEDVTEARDFEQRQNLLINELNHRVKNTLAVVQSLVRHTLRDHGAPKETESAVTERLLALSSAHNVLNREEWKGADLEDLVREVVRPCDPSGHVSTAGPRAWIAPKAAIALAMALHELATNAVKHGGLSSPEGRVELTWTRDCATVALEWREFGGPPVSEPDTAGFGSILLGRMLAGELGQAAEIVYAPDGLTCRIWAPVSSDSLQGASRDLTEPHGSAD
jgi:PAS domain S-box-containing protein